MADLLGFDIDQYFANSQHNYKRARENLAPFMGHFQVLSTKYEDLLKGVSIEEVDGDASRIARLNYLAYTPINLMKASINILCGHFTDGNIYHRRAIEAVRYSAFLREKPEVAGKWIWSVKPENRRAFESAYKSWFKGKSDGEKMVTTELGTDPKLWSSLSNVGPHSNMALMSFSTEIIKVGGRDGIRTNYHEITPNEHGTALLTQYFIKNLSISISRLMHTSTVPRPTQIYRQEPT